MSDTRQHSGYGSPPWGAPTPFSALVEQSAHLLRAWADVWFSFLRIGLPQGSSYEDASSCMQTRPLVAHPVSVRTRSHDLGMGTACLTPGAERMPLELSVPGLEAMTICQQGFPVALVVEVTGEPRAGVYFGKITAYGREVGDVTLAIQDRP